MNKRTAQPRPSYRLHPKIILEVCYVCGGRGFVLAVRQQKQVRDPCVNCASAGTVARES